VPHSQTPRDIAVNRKGSFILNNPTKHVWVSLAIVHDSDTSGNSPASHLSWSSALGI